MGQYYKPCILKKNWKTAKNAVKATLSSYDFSNGAKLMEHSYVGNSFMRAVMYLLANDYFGYNFVWGGDYADEVTTRTGAHLMYDDACNLMYDSNDKKKQSYINLLLRVFNTELPTYKYIVNFTKKEYVEVPPKKKGEWTIHPLSLLTVDGNGRGGGDYGIEDNRVGRWKYDRIGVTNDITDYAHFKKIDGIFELDW